MNWFFAGRSIKYFIFSKHKNGHGIHSPFVYSLIKDVFKNKTSLALVKPVERSRMEYRKDRRVITVNDPGSGSLKKSSRERKISDIVKIESIKPSYGALISRLASLVDGKLIIEMGTSLGIGTMYLSLGAPRSRVITIEGCKNIASIANNNFLRNNLKNIELVRGDFDDKLEDILENTDELGLVYIDGNNRAEDLLRYMDQLFKYTNENTIIIVDDIHCSKDMEQGWNRLKESNYVVISIDLRQMGLLFFNKGIRKQNFVIKY